MNKKLFLVLLVSALSLWCFTLIYGVALEQGKDQGKEVTKEQLQAPVRQTVERPSREMFEKMISYKGLTVEKNFEILQNTFAQVPPGTPVAYVGPEGTFPEGEAYLGGALCRSYNHDFATCCYYQPGGNDYMGCWPDQYDEGWPIYPGVHWAQLQDPERRPFAYSTNPCPYPIYPLNITRVAMQIYSPDSATIVYEAGVSTPVWIDSVWCAYPANAANTAPPSIAVSAQYTVLHPGGWALVAAPMPAGVCVYERFFAHFSIINDDDFDTTWCGPTAHLLMSPLYDISGERCRAYWTSFGLNSPDPGGMPFLPYWYDAVENGMVGGNVRVQAYGYTWGHADNTCAPGTEWYFKAEKFDEDNDPYAPAGIPDFHQVDPVFPNNGLAYCGPTAVANCFWWAMNAGFPEYVFPTGRWVGPDPTGTPMLINELAGYFQTDSVTGTDVFEMQAGLEALKAARVLWFTEVTDTMPDFWTLQYQLRQSQDIILLLGFWFEEPAGVWHRYGGHYVTMAGVNKFTWEFALSDPFFDNAEPPVGGPGMVISAGVFTPHVMPHPPPDCQHFDAGNASHDYYLVTTPSASPGGIIALPDYAYMKDLSKFVGQNCPPEFLPMQGYTYSGQTIHTEVEYAVIICPELPFKCATISDYRGADMWTAMTKCNYGREGARDDNGFYFDPYPYGATVGSPLFDGSIILGNAPANLAFFGGDNDPAGEFWPYLPIDIGYYKVPFFTNPSTGTPESLGVNTLWTKAYHNKGLSLDVEIKALAFDDTLGYGGGEFVIQDFVITNTGLAPITDLRFTIHGDWDLGPDLHFDSCGGLDPVYGYQFCTLDTLLFKFGYARVPLDGFGADRFRGVDNPIYMHPNAGWGWVRDTLWNIMNGVAHDRWDGTAPRSDYSIMMTSRPFSLNAGDSHTESYVVFGYKGPDPQALAAVSLKKLIFTALKFKGFYRGDVDGTGAIDLTDVVYLAKFVILPGNPAPIPFADQGDVDANGTIDLTDVVYLAKYVILPGNPAPLDYGRFAENPFPFIPSLFLNPVFGKLGE